MVKSLGKKLSFMQGSILTIMFVIFVFITFQFLNSYTQQKEYDVLVEKVNLLKKTIELQNMSLKSSTDGYFNIFKSFFDREITIDNQNRIDVKGVSTPTVKHGDEVLNLNFAFVDRYTNITNSTATVFARDGDDFVRVSTSLKKQNGDRAIGTYLGKKSPAYQPIMSGNSYKGKARLFGIDYMTKYSPIIKNGEIIGILYIGYNITKELKLLNESIKDVQVNGSGSAFVINSKGSVLSDSRGNILSERDVDGIEYIKEIIAKKEGTLTYKVRESGSVKEMVATISYFKPWDYILVITCLKEDIFKDTNEFIAKFISFISVAVVVLLVAIVVLMNILISMFVTKPLRKLEKRAKDLSSKDGDLTKRLQIYSKDEISKVSQEVNNFIEKIQNTISTIKDSSLENASVSNEIFANAKQIGSRVENEANIVSELVLSNQNLRDLLKDSIKKASDTKNNIQNSNDKLTIARSGILDMINKISHASEVEVELSNRLNTLSSDAEQVKSVLSVIADIAEQTNLLALNAAIEAARAGEHGRGFAVVADEVRQLAERTQKSLSEINSTINLIVQSIIDVASQMSDNVQTIEDLSKSSSDIENQIEETFEIMQTNIYLSNDSLDNISNIKEQFKIENQKLDDIQNLSNSNARAVEEMVGAIDNSHLVAEHLSLKLNEFKT